MGAYVTIAFFDAALVRGTLPITFLVHGALPGTYAVNLQLLQSDKGLPKAWAPAHCALRF